MPNVQTWRCDDGHEFQKNKAGAEEGAAALLMCRECGERKLCECVEITSENSLPFDTGSKTVTRILSHDG